MTAITSQAPAARSHHPQSGAAKILFRCLALILIVAAAAKAFAGWRDTAMSVVLWLEITTELTLAVWLVSGSYIHGAWFVAFAAFLAFACVSLFKVLTQAPDCGCFGHAPVPPAVMFTVDWTVVTSLVVVRHVRAPSTGGLHKRLGYSAIVLVIGVVLLGIARHRSGAAVTAELRATATIVPSHDAANVPSSVDHKSQDPHADFIGKAMAPALWEANLGDVPPGAELTVLFKIFSPNCQRARKTGQ
jgi:hypothetical protein